MSPAQLAEAVNTSTAVATYWAPILDEAMFSQGIVNLLPRAAFLAQASYESGNFSRLVENMNYKTPAALMRAYKRYFPTVASCEGWLRQPRKLGDRVYAPRGTRLPESSGGGYDKRGHGLFQITWESNHARVLAGLGLDYSGSLSEPAHAAASAAWWWRDLDLNDLAEGLAIDQITRAINGPAMLGKAERAMIFYRAAKVLQ